MIELDDKNVRGFNGLDARETQEALAAEMSDTDENLSEVDGEDAIDVAAEGEAVEDKAVETSGKKPKKKRAKKKKAPEPVIEWSEEDLAEHERMVEALLFAAAEPLDIESIADRMPGGADIEALLCRITERYEARGFNLVQIEKTWRFVTAADVAHVLEKEKVTPRRLSRAAMETLAIIAYHQPCTRADIEDVRGVQVSKGSLDQLLEIGWVAMRGKRKDVPGRPTLYGTTPEFLSHFTLETVQDLPGLSDLKAAGLLDARLPPGFSVPVPQDGDELADDEADDDAEFAQDFLAEGEDADIGDESSDEALELES